jgi:hypothetical protein
MAKVIADHKFRIARTDCRSAALVTLAALLFTTASTAKATVIHVTLPSMYGAGCTLREVIQQEEGHPLQQYYCPRTSGDDEIIIDVPDIFMTKNGFLPFPPGLGGATVTLTTPLPKVTIHGLYLSLGGNLTIKGPIGLSAGLFGEFTVPNSFLVNGQGSTLRLAGTGIFSNHGDSHFAATPYYGGAINNLGTLIIEGTPTFSDNKAEVGGAIANEVSGHAARTNMLFFRNSGKVVFSNNSAQLGAAIYNRLGRVEIDNAEFRGNSARDGSAVFTEQTPKFGFRTTTTIANSLLDGNKGSSIGRGGALTVENAELSIANTRIINNSEGDAAGSGRGGAIYVDHLSTLRMRNSECANNTARAGGCIWASSPEVTMDGVSCHGNRGSNGGCVHVDTGGAVSLVRSTCSGNSSSFGGCAGVTKEAELTADNSSITANHAGGGGGIFGDGSRAEVVVNDSIVTTNSANRGGGILSVGPNAALVINASTLANNKAPVGSGVQAEHFSAVVAVNSTFANQGSKSVPGIHLVNSHGELVFSTFSSAYLHADGVVEGDLRDSILLNSSSCLGHLADGGFNIQFPAAEAVCRNTIPVVNPMLDPAGLRDNGGPTPTIAELPGSPSRNTIPLMFCTGPNGHPLRVDQRGLPRPDPHGEPLCDKGAFQYQTAEPPSQPRRRE